MLCRLLRIEGHLAGLLLGHGGCRVPFLFLGLLLSGYRHGHREHRKGD
jgi:hypothetical protein